MSKTRAPSNWFNKKSSMVFDLLPIPSYAWQSIENDLVLIKYNSAALDFTNLNLEEQLGVKASEFYIDEPKIFNDLLDCVELKNSFSKKRKYNLKDTNQERILNLNYGFAPPDIVIVNIMDMKKTIDSEEMFKLISENANDVILIVNENSIIKYVNQRPLQSLTGYSPEEIIGKKPREFIHPDYLENNIFSIGKYLKKRKGITQIKIRHKKGHYINVELSISLYLDNTGIVNQLIIIRDITDRVKFEEELNIAKDKYKLITDNVNDLITIINEDYIIEYINEKIHKIQRGITNEDIIGISALKILHPDDKEEDIKSFKNILEVGEGIFEIRLRNLGGGYDWFEVKGKTFMDLDGKKKVILISRNITEKRHTQQKLRESEENFRTIIEDSQLAITILQDDIVKYTNQRMADLFGYDREEMLNWTPKEYAKTVAEDSLEVVMEQAKKKQMGEPDIILQYPIHSVKKSGEKFWVDNISNTIMYNGRPADLVTLTDITEKLDSEKKLKESEEKFRSLVETTTDWIWELDENGVYTYSSPKIKDILGYDAEEIIGKTPFDLMPSYEAERVEKIFQKIREGKEPITNLENKNLHKNGSIITLETNGIPLFNTDGEFVGYRGIDRNITEKKESEKKLSESEEKLRAFINEAPDIIFNVDRNGNILFINRVPQGYNIDKVIGTNFINYVHPEYKELTKKKFENIFKTGKSDRCEIKAYGGHGELRWISLNLGAIKEKNQINSVLIILRDITRRKKSEEKLRESEEKFRTITEQSFLGIAILQDNRIKYVNEQMANIFDYSTEEIISWQPGEFLKVIFSEDRVFVTQQLIKKQLGESDATDQYQFRGVTKNNDIIWLETFSRTINFGGRPADFVTLLDITEKKKSEQKLKESEEKYKDLSVELETILDIIPGMLYCKDKSGILIRVNENLANLIGLKKDEIIGKSIYELFPYEQAKKTHSDDLDVINSGEPKLNIEEYFDFPEGKMLILTNKVPHMNQKGETIGSIGLSVDISERKVIEEKLIKSEYALRERLKELGCLYDLSRFIENPNTTIDNILQAASNRLTLAFRFPEIISVKIYFNDKEYRTHNYIETKWKLTSTERINGDILGIEVYYNEDTAFLDEEVTFLKEFTSRVKNFLEIKKIEENLLSEKEFSEDLINTTSDTIFVFEPETGKAIRWNDSFRKVSGYSDEEISNLKAPDTYYDQEDLKKAGEAIKKLIDEGEVTVEMTLITKEGEYIPFEYRARTFETIDGKILIVSYGRDITERKMVELKLRESEEKFRSLAEQSLLGILILQDNKVKYFNKKLSEQLGYPIENLKDWTLEDFLKITHPEDRDFVKEQSIKKQMGMKDVLNSYEYRFFNAVGELRWVHILSVTIFYGDKPANFASLLDITEKKNTEQKLKKSEERYRLISKNSRSVVWETDMKLNLTYIGDSSSILGYSSEEIMKLSTDKIITESSLKKIIRIFREEKKIDNSIKKDLNRSRSFEIEQIHKNGSIVPSEITITFLRDSSGNAIGLLGITRDITERKDAEKELVESEKKYREAYARANLYKDLFAHDINNILQIINSSAEIIKYHLDDSDKSKDIENIAKMIRKQIARAKILVHNVNILSELDQGELKTNPTEINKVLDNSKLFLKSAYPDKEIEFKINSYNGRIFVQAN
ncbi:MAG: PAS domain-containing protein, partial [Candidatus Hermodarchaeota archaeon]